MSNRRNFLKTSAGLAASLAAGPLTGAQSPPAASLPKVRFGDAEITETDTTDLEVIDRSDGDTRFVMTYVGIDVESSIERIADHATNVAEASIYAMEGTDIRHHNLENESTD